MKIFADGEDYTGGEKVLEFVAGDGIGVTRCLNYSIINDNIPEDTKDFRVSVSTDDADILLVEGGQVRVFIIDDDGKWLVYGLKYLWKSNNGQLQLLPRMIM